MGTNCTGDSTIGIVPKVIETIFKRVEETKSTTDFLIKVSFIEIFKEEVYDLLDSNQGVNLKADVNRKPIKPPSNATEAEVTSQEDMASYLHRGSVCRATASTNMNSESSRSHAIFTISIKQQKINDGITTGGCGDDIGDVLFSKFHLVDLAGSESSKKTGRDKNRFQEGIDINRGLLALGRVIRVLVDDQVSNEGGHVPYRDSKLTLFLKDSLGGNCKTLMIACVSPADVNVKETVNTLRYANHARKIQNKPMVNHDLEGMRHEMQSMRRKLEELKAEVKQKDCVIRILNEEMKEKDSELKSLKEKMKEKDYEIRVLKEERQKMEEDMVIEGFMKKCGGVREGDVQELPVVLDSDTSESESKSESDNEYHYLSSDDDDDDDVEELAHQPTTERLSRICCRCTEKAGCKTIRCKCRIAQICCCGQCRCRLIKCWNQPYTEPPSQAAMHIATDNEEEEVVIM
ncbi:kinesin-like protein KIN-4C isoform X2 [Rutidosis leptorrhynchoides]